MANEIFSLSSLTKKQIVSAFVYNLNMIEDGCFTTEGRINAIKNLENLRDAYTGKSGYGAIENQMMKVEIENLKSK
jgi:hypothetical protein